MLLKRPYYFSISNFWISILNSSYSCFFLSKNLNESEKNKANFSYLKNRNPKYNAKIEVYPKSQDNYQDLF